MPDSGDFFFSEDGTGAGLQSEARGRIERYSRPNKRAETIRAGYGASFGRVTPGTNGSWLALRP